MKNKTMTYLKKELKDELDMFGFELKRNIFFKIRNDLAFCIAVEHPGLYYLRFFVLPLYMPLTGVNFTFGNQINVVLENEATTFQAGFIKSLLSNTIFPFFETVSSPERIVLFLNQRDRIVREFFFCPKIWLDLLNAYTALKVFDDKIFSTAICSAYKSLATITFYSPPVLERLKQEIVELEMVALLPTEDRISYFNENIHRSIQVCFY